MLIFLITLFGCTIGGLCGLGGGTLIKPLFNLLAVMPTSESTFLCGITVMLMALMSVFLRRKSHLVQYKLSTALAIGSIIGGALGKNIFTISYKYFTDKQIGIIQSAILMGLLIILIVYNEQFKYCTKTFKVTNPIITFLIGTIMGVIATFLGIGGGAINLAVLFYFFSMKINEASINSLYIIILSQVAGFLELLVTNTIPNFNVNNLFIMLISGVTGATISSIILKNIDEYYINNIFIIVLYIAVTICGINIVWTM